MPIKKRPRGNPAFVKGNPGGPGRPKGSLIKIPRCASFMETKGWAELERIALRSPADKVRVAAIQLLAAYGYGRPSEQIDVTSGGNAMSMADFLTSGSNGQGSTDS